MSLVLLGSTSGSVTLQEPAIAGSTVIDLPATSGTMAVTSGSPSFTNITATGNLTVNGNTTLGDASTDTILMTGAPSIGGAGLGMGMGFRNRIINGAMVIDQRNAGASVTPTSSQYSLDRWNLSLTVASKFSFQQSTTAPTGFANSMLFTSTSAYSVGSSDFFLASQSIEGFNTADLMWGTANAQTVTLSFWVRSSLTGTFGGCVTNSAQNRSYPFTFTISSANTFEYKTITIAGDTSGTWIGSTNGRGIVVWFSLGAGSTYSGTSGAWSGSNVYSATGATSVVGTNGATFYITGVQLEKGSTATSFDYRPYGTELALCQRYFFVAVTGSAKYWGMGQNYSASALTSYIQFPVTMRTAPTSASTSGTNYYGFYRNGTNDDFNSITLEAAQVQGTGFFNNSEISGTAGHSGNLYTNNTASFIAFQAEL
jgi:hypothetical protein